MFLFNNYYDKRYGRIVASAIRKGNKIYKGKTHSDCLVQRPIGELRFAEQGFITDNGTFVNRKLALKIAKHYKQIYIKHPPKDELLSEDLIKIERR